MGTKNEKMYSVNGLMPAIDVHPGEILGEELKARGISQKEFAEKASMQQTHLSALIHGVRNITPAVAAKLEAALEGISADFWMGMQEDYNRNRQRRKLRTSHLVDGYGSPAHSPSFALADSAEPVPYAGKITVSITIPEEDKNLFFMLCDRFGWKY